MLAGDTLYVIVVRYKWMLLFAKRFTVADLPLCTLVSLLNPLNAGDKQNYSITRLNKPKVLVM